MANQLNDIPSSLEPIATKQFDNGKQMQLDVTSVWYKFFVSMSAVLSNLIGGVLGFTVEDGITATGATQATAYQMTTEWAEVTTTPVGSGIMINGFGAGVPSTVFNHGANSLNVYPPVGSQINGLGVNNPYGLVSPKMQTFYQTSSNQFWSTQLG